MITHFDTETRADTTTPFKWGEVAFVIIVGGLLMFGSYSAGHIDGRRAALEQAKAAKEACWNGTDWVICHPAPVSTGGTGGTSEAGTTSGLVVSLRNGPLLTIPGGVKPNGDAGMIQLDVRGYVFAVCVPPDDVAAWQQKIRDDARAMLADRHAQPAPKAQP